MDLSSLASTLLSKDTIKTLSKRTDVSQKDVTNVLSAALPMLLDGANKQAEDADSGFENALKDHAKKDTGDIASFLGGVDLADGAKIIGHLLGGKNDSDTEEIAEKTGVSTAKTGTVLAAAAPLLMSLLGQQTEKESGSPVGALMGSLLSNVDMGDLLGGLLGVGGNDDEEETGKKKKKKKAAEEEESGLGDLVGGLLGSLLK